MSDDQYIKNIEERNEQIQNRLTIAEEQLLKLRRKKGIFVIFKIFKTKIGKNWIENDEFLTVCSDIENVKMCLKYNINNPPITINPDELIGYKYWRQPQNYRWSVHGMCKFFNTKLKLVNEINLNKKTGKVTYE